ncbi:glycerophosphoryl diester phosphodiesterase family protein [Asticcacaulis biprosthecium C19]|uniref:Glycerophosphoryl diester phosphodiesterase family protein n=1 Tax=Asticcacaulis biprosthecium C19 TaxID=715226 RepID=F4QQ61_9CAUL|nr:glycerophosphoryl diester phosphodiesterase family protein [Asticcacaulis biprosthecium C19]
MAAGSLAAASAILYVMNASWLASAPDSQPQLLAHRGVYQHYNRDGLKNDTCTATRIAKPTHDYLENTLPSMRAAFDAGADAVEIDIHPTTDGDFAVFHDWTVDCRTDGKGVTREHSLAALKALDIGYGYTHDGGKTFPFRGRFKAQMPSLSEVLTAFPDKAFLINIKSNSPRESEKLDAWLREHPEAHPQRLSVFAGERSAQRLAELRPDLKPVSKQALKTCGFTYIALGWSGYVPKACHNTTVYVPQNLTWVMWGYPNRLQERFAKAGSYIYLVGPMKSTNGLPSINTPEDYAKVPKSWRMGVATDSIEVIGPLAKSR